MRGRYNQVVSVISRRIAILSGLTAAAGCRRKRGDGFAGYAFVANEEGRAIAVVDLTAFAVVRHIRLPGAPTDLIAHENGRTVYAITADHGGLHEIDTGHMTIRRSMALDGPAVSMRAEPGGKAFWILSRSARLLRVDPVDMRITASVALPESGGDFDISEWTRLGAVTHPGGRTVSLASLDDGKVLKTIPAGGEPGSIRFRSDGKALLLANRSERMLTVFDCVPPDNGPPSGRVMVHLPLAVRPDHLCIHPDGGQVFITGEGRDAVVVVYPYYAPEVAETILAGSRPGAMGCSRSHLFVTNPMAGDVSIVSVERRRVVAAASVGAEPGYVTITPDEEYALVLNRKSGDMAVLRIAGLQPDRRKIAALFTLIPVGSKPVSAVVTAV